MMEEESVKKPLRHLKYPATYNWASINGKNYLSAVRNENTPHYCGACWAFATVSALNDRFNHYLNGSFPQVNLSPQVLINCVNGGSCDGGNPKAAYDYINKTNIQDATFDNYKAIKEECSMFGTRKSRLSGKVPYLYRLNDYGTVQGVDNMKEQLMNGPISCGMEVTDSFINYNGGIFSEKKPLVTLNHEVSITGWGVDNSTGNETEFWYVRNSWGSFWGINGFAKVMMHQNNLGLEKDCLWATPNISYIPPISRALEKTSDFDYLDYRNYSGEDFTTVCKNQNSSYPLSSCYGWAMAVASSLSDSLKIARKKTFPEVNLSPQVLINCVKCDCNKIQDCIQNSYEWVQKNGIPDDSCTNYIGHSEECSPNYTCRTCDASGHCAAVFNYSKYNITSMGNVSGVESMKNQIRQTGPITCVLHVTEEFKEFQGGHVFVDESPSDMDDPNHAVSVAGWGDEINGDQFWIARNSWGTNWGDDGWFRIKLGEQTLGIETLCFWGMNDDWKK